jgi:hypothetical protein
MSREPQTDLAAGIDPQPQARSRKVAYDALIESIAWVIQELDLFSPSDITVPGQMKPITELAMLYGYTAQWWCPEIRKQLLPIGSFLVRMFTNSTLAHWMRRLPCNYAYYATGYLALRAAGERIQVFEEAILYLDRGGYPFAIEKLPYLEIAARYGLWKAGLRSKPPGIGMFFQRTSVARCRNPIYLSTQEVYSITHTLFYTTDIAGPCSDMPVLLRSRIVALLETLLIHYWRKSDWDVAGEILLNLVALDQFSTPFFGSAFSACISARLPSGAMPGPGFAAGNVALTRKKVFEGCYHTTLVAIFLWGAYLYRTKIDAQ